MKIRLTPHVYDQQNILFFDRRVGYCGTKPNMPVCFLNPRECRLTDDEKREVIAFVQEHVGHVKPTPQTKKYMTEIADVNEGTNTSSERQAC